ncbi:hypothetical protein Tco_0963617 [Tanacetum coccineum]
MSPEVRLGLAFGEQYFSPLVRFFNGVDTWIEDFAGLDDALFVFSFPFCLLYELEKVLWSAIILRRFSGIRLLFAGCAWGVVKLPHLSQSFSRRGVCLRFPSGPLCNAAIGGWSACFLSDVTWLGLFFVNLSLWDLGMEGRFVLFSDWECLVLHLSTFFRLKYILEGFFMLLGGVLGGLRNQLVFDASPLTFDDF